MANMEEVLETLEKQKDKYTHESVAKFFKDWNKKLQYHFTDIDEYYVIELVKGIPQPIVKEKLKNPDIMYSMSTDTFLKLNRGEISGFKAYQRKELKIKATMPEIMKLQKLDKL
jgi:putative sterol carrier protein